MSLSYIVTGHAATAQAFSGRYVVSCLCASRHTFCWTAPNQSRDPTRDSSRADLNVFGWGDIKKGRRPSVGYVTWGRVEPSPSSVSHARLVHLL